MKRGLLSTWLKPKKPASQYAGEVKALIELLKIPTTTTEEIFNIWPTLYFNLRNDEKMSLNAVNFSIVANDNALDRNVFLWALEHLHRTLENSK